MRILAYWRLLSIAVLVFALDQLTKAWIEARLPTGTYGEVGGEIVVIPRFIVIPHFLYIVHVGNTGAAWSLFTGRSFALAALAAVTLVAIFIWRRALGLRSSSAQVAFGLLCGGIAGNLADRVIHGHVVDFIDLHFGTYIYPTFNVADSAICVGVAFYLLQSLRQPAA